MSDMLVVRHLISYVNICVVITDIQIQHILFVSMSLLVLTYL